MAQAPIPGHARLCQVDELAEGKARGFDPAGTGRDTMFVVHRAGGLHAWRDDCPHWRGTPLPWRKNAYLNGDGSRIVCSAHGAQFVIDSGLCTVGPCSGQSLTPVPLVHSDDGSLYVQLSLFQEIHP